MGGSNRSNGSYWMTVLLIISFFFLILAAWFLYRSAKAVVMNNIYSLLYLKAIPEGALNSSPLWPTSSEKSQIGSRRRPRTESRPGMRGCLTYSEPCIVKPSTYRYQVRQQCGDKLIYHAGISSWSRSTRWQRASWDTYERGTTTAAGSAAPDHNWTSTISCSAALHGAMNAPNYIGSIRQRWGHGQTWSGSC